MQNEKKSPVTPNVILLDVYHTLLDMSEMERRVNNLLDSRKGYNMWLNLFMQYCFVENCTVQFNNFLSIAKATLQMAAYSLDKKVEAGKIETLLEFLKHLPLQESVQEGLSQLYSKGYRIAALTNSPLETVLERMEFTGLISYFDMVMSAEQVKKYKPCLDVYLWAIGKLNVNARDVLMVSAHGWDLAGAAYAGMNTAHLNLTDEMLYPLAPSPDFTAKTLAELARKLPRLSK